MNLNLFRCQILDVTGPITTYFTLYIYKYRLEIYSIGFNIF
jgi:hypothetical protein